MEREKKPQFVDCSLHNEYLWSTWNILPPRIMGDLSVQLGEFKFKDDLFADYREVSATCNELFDKLNDIFNEFGL